MEKMTNLVDKSPKNKENKEKQEGITPEVKKLMEDTARITMKIEREMGAKKEKRPRVGPKKVSGSGSLWEERPNNYTESQGYKKLSEKLQREKALKIEKPIEELSTYIYNKNLESSNEHKIAQETFHAEKKERKEALKRVEDFVDKRIGEEIEKLRKRDEMGDSEEKTENSTQEEQVAETLNEETPENAERKEAVEETINSTDDKAEEEDEKTKLLRWRQNKSPARLEEVRKRMSELSEIIGKSKSNTLAIEENEELKKEEASLLETIAEIKKLFPEGNKKETEAKDEPTEEKNETKEELINEKGGADNDTKPLETPEASYGIEIEKAEESLNSTRIDFVNEYLGCMTEVNRQTLIDKTKNSILNTLIRVKNIFSKEKDKLKSIKKPEDFFTDKTREAKKAYDDARINLGNIMYEAEKARFGKYKTVSESDLRLRLKVYKQEEIFKKIIIEENKKIIGLSEDNKLFSKSPNSKFANKQYDKREELRRNLLKGEGPITIEGLERYEGGTEKQKKEIKKHLRNRSLRKKIVAGAIILAGTYAIYNNSINKTMAVEGKNENDKNKKEIEKPPSRVDNNLHIDAEKFRSENLANEKNNDGIQKDTNSSQEINKEEINTTNENGGQTVEQTYNQKINSLFPDNANTFAWDNIKGKKAKDMFRLKKENALNDTYKPLASYLEELQGLTNLEPKEEQTIEDYMKEVLKKRYETKR